MQPVELKQDPYSVDLQQGVNPLNSESEAYLQKLKE